MTTITDRLKELGLTLPEPSVPVAAYVPFVLSGKMLFISGQLPLENGKVAVTGKLGVDVDLAAGRRAAELCALNLLAHLNKACGGDMARVGQCVKLSGFVACAADFYEQPQVINGASELIANVLGEKGKHARAAVGVPALPRNAAVEVEAVFSLA